MCVCAQYPANDSSTPLQVASTVLITRARTQTNKAAVAAAQLPEVAVQRDSRANPSLSHRSCADFLTSIISNTPSVSGASVGGYEPSVANTAHDSGIFLQGQEGSIKVETRPCLHLCFAEFLNVLRLVLVKLVVHPDAQQALSYIDYLCVLKLNVRSRCRSLPLDTSLCQMAHIGAATSTAPSSSVSTSRKCNLSKHATVAITTLGGLEF